MRNKPLLQIVLAAFILAIILIIILGPFYTKDMDRQIIISDADVAQIYTGWQRTWQRPPTQEELRAQLKKYVRDELLYQEALRLGYDKNDMVIRNTLIRKMIFLAEGQADDKKISDNEIQAYYNLRKSVYRLSPEISFFHVFFNRDQRGESTAGEVTSFINQYNKKIFPEDIKSLGDRFMLENQYANKSIQEIQNLFGKEFVEQISTLPLEIWSGPVSSGYGLHAVYVYNKKESIIPDWKDIKYKILNDMVLEEKAAARDQFYTELMRQYKIVYQGTVEEILKEAEE